MNKEILKEYLKSFLENESDVRDFLHAIQVYNFSTSTLYCIAEPFSEYPIFGKSDAGLRHMIETVTRQTGEEKDLYVFSNEQLWDELRGSIILHPYYQNGESGTEKITWLYYSRMPIRMSILNKIISVSEHLQSVKR